jgi:hypothetical protein
MDTQVRTPQLVFMQPQRLVVPLFQRPYVWTKDVQWEPLWKDVVRVAERVLLKPAERHQPHFLGAVVLQQVQNPVGRMQQRMIIDGQQRLTTLQLLLDALHAELLNIGATSPALRLEPLVSNAEAFCEAPEDHFKVWPTNRDRAAFNEVMSAPPPVDYHKLVNKHERLVEAHEYFSEQARLWLAGEDSAEVQRKASAIETVARELLQLVVIDLNVDENAQEIFETLNARGTPLGAADLIKNFVFQRLLEANADVEGLYEKYWKEFETGFWETQVNVGRLNYPRSSIFLNHWLVARTGLEIVARQVFESFKRFSRDSTVPMIQQITQIHNASKIYREFITKAALHSGAIDRLGLFGYRTGVLESEVIKPIVLCLLDPLESLIPADQMDKALDVVESWMVRRMLVRATTKSYNKIVAEMISRVRASRLNAGDQIETYLRAESSDSSYWPDDSEVRAELKISQVYRRISRARLRMILEAVEDYRRGWLGDSSATDNDRVTRSKYAIEHVMPRRWAEHWPLAAGEQTEAERDSLIHTLGNLTLLTGKLNSKVSNGPWMGQKGKRAGLEGHDVLKLNRELLKAANESWTETLIRSRTKEMIEAVIAIWPVPQGHKSGHMTDSAASQLTLSLLDLISGGALLAGTELFPRPPKHADRLAVLLGDGRIEVEGKEFDSASAAAGFLTGQPTNGWSFFLVDKEKKRSLKSVRKEYVSQMAVNDSEDEDDDDEEE